MNIAAIIVCAMMISSVASANTITAGLDPVTYNVVSNVSTGLTQVSTAQLLQINPDPNTPFPKNMMVGSSFQVKIDVNNPNPITINGYVLLNLTSLNGSVGANDVSVSSGFSDMGFAGAVQFEGITGNTFTFEISQGGNPLYYFPFRPGLSVNVTWVGIQYNVAGQYDWSLAVCQ